jgi:hypothetical protein
MIKSVFELPITTMDLLAAMLPPVKFYSAHSSQEDQHEACPVDPQFRYARIVPAAGAIKGCATV